MCVRYFLDQKSRLLFFHSAGSNGDYSRAVSIRGWCQLTLTVKPHCLLSHQNDNCFVRELAIAN